MSIELGAEASPDQPAQPDQPEQPEPFAFTGSGAEYFRIWIVNIALTIVTFGIYSAWAKVRRLEYFYRNTRLAGSSFDYHGNPIAILKGRIIGFILFGAYSLAGRVSPWHALAALGVIALIMPWLLASALRFRCHNSSYRGIRFRFTGSTAGAYWVFLGLPLLSIFTLFTLVPFVHQRIKKYEHGHAWFGTAPFTISVGPGAFYSAYLIAFGVMVAGVMAIAVMSGVLGAVAALLRDAPAPGTTDPQTLTLSPGMWVAFALIMVVYVFMIVTVQAVMLSRVQNAVWNSSTLGPHRFASRLQARRLVGLMFTNLLATIATIGLFTPFAQVRMARYMAETMELKPRGSLDDFVAADAPEVSALGEETAGLFDIDIAF
jgi:uncharacterized membrane protein YjgN (DUF898 family)